MPPLGPSYRLCAGGRGSVCTDHLGQPSISLEGWSLPLSEIKTKCSWDRTKVRCPRALSHPRGVDVRADEVLPSLPPMSLGRKRPAASSRERQGSAGPGLTRWVAPGLFRTHLCESCRAGCSAGLPFGSGSGARPPTVRPTPPGSGSDVWEIPPLAGQRPPAGSPGESE